MLVDSGERPGSEADALRAEDKGEVLVLPRGEFVEGDRSLAQAECGDREPLGAEGLDAFGPGLETGPRHLEDAPIETFTDLR